MDEGGEIPGDRGSLAPDAVPSHQQDHHGYGQHDQHDSHNGYDNHDVLPGDDDPLRVKELALRFDYLLYRLKDHIATVLQEAVERVENKDNLTRFNDLLNMDEQIAYLQRLLVSLQEIDSDIATIRQVSEIVSGFRLRIKDVERELKG